MTEFEIQNSLWKSLNRKNFALACPNYTPLGWWECDLFGVTAAGLGVEFEIKLTRADFMADAKKERQKPGRKYGELPEIQRKHSLLSGRHQGGPTRFFYACPAGLLTLEDMPEWAGLMTYESGFFSTPKEAPKLHSTKVSQKVMDHMRGVFYWRYWNQRCLRTT
jgi:hypothetical protein